MAESKDAFYFPHDSNAHEDPKCVLMIEQLGPEAYGIYWILVELLRDQPGYRYPLALIPSIARKYNTTSEKVGVVIRNYELFIVTEDSFFYSESLNRRMEIWGKKREQARLAAQKRWGIDANALPEHCRSNASKEDLSKEEERKKEIKDKNIAVPFEEIKELYHSTCKTLPKLQKLSDERKKHLKARWEEYPNIATFEKLFQLADKSKFLSGRSGKWMNCSFDWLINKANMLKVLEGNYNRDLDEKIGADNYQETIEIIQTIDPARLRAEELRKEYHQ